MKFTLTNHEWSALEDDGQRWLLRTQLVWSGVVTVSLLQAVGVVVYVMVADRGPFTPLAAASFAVALAVVVLFFMFGTPASLAKRWQGRTP